MMTWSIGDEIEVLEPLYRYPILGKIVSLDTHPFGDSFAKVRLSNSPAIDAPELWVNLRRAKKV